MGSSSDIRNSIQIKFIILTHEVSIYAQGLIRNLKATSLLVYAVHSCEEPGIIN